VIVHDVVQGTAEWQRLRAGIPTASSFDRIVTPTGKPSSQAAKYLHWLLAERITGRPLEGAVTSWMARGLDLEAEAVAYYEGIRDQDTERVGFVTDDAGRYGASPDRFVGAEGLLEIKAPASHTHVGYLVSRAVDADYYPQIQGQLWVCGRRWSDVLSYHPEMPPALIRVPRDEAFIALLERHVSAFVATLETAAQEAKERGWIRA
jgi:hypothetical protein